MAKFQPIFVSNENKERFYETIKFEDIERYKRISDMLYDKVTGILYFIEKVIEDDFLI